jgi:S-(hydroxymethyl)glutathione dehydrogenase/alcohol dehydrogenase
MKNVKKFKIQEKYCQAAVLRKLNTELEICTLEIPELLDGQILVKVLFSGVCRSQLMEITGGRGDDPWLPHLLGHEGSGIVIDVGEKVTKIQPGDEVILGWIKGSGLDAQGAKYRCGEEIINSGRVTTFSNYTVVSESRVFKKPIGMTFESAVLFGCALPTGAGMVLNDIKPTRYQSIVILGLGGIGMSAIMAAKALQIENIIAIDISEDKLKWASELGIKNTISSTDASCKQQVLEWTNGGADYCIESAGKISTIELGFSLIRTGGGKLVFASHPPDTEFIKLKPHELISGKQISGTWGGAVDPENDIQKMYTLFRDTKMPIDTLLTKKYPLQKINDALQDLEMGKVFRPLIVMTH